MTWCVRAVGATVVAGVLGSGLACAPRPAVPTAEARSPRAELNGEERSQTIAIVIGSNQVTAGGRVVDSLGRDEQFALRSKGRDDFTGSLVDALRPHLTPARDIVVGAGPDVPFISVARVMLALMALGHESVELVLSAGPTRIALAREIYLHDEVGLLVLMATLGVSIKGPGGNIAPGCQDLGPGLAIPRVEGRLAFGSLTECVARLVQLDSRLGRAYLSANPETPFHDIVDTADALAAGGAPLIGLRLGG